MHFRINKRQSNRINYIFIRIPISIVTSKKTKTVPGSIDCVCHKDLLEGEPIGKKRQPWSPTEPRGGGWQKAAQYSLSPALSRLRQEVPGPIWSGTDLLAAGMEAPAPHQQCRSFVLGHSHFIKLQGVLQEAVGSHLSQAKILPDPRVRSIRIYLFSKMLHSLLNSMSNLSKLVVWFCWSFIFIVNSFSRSH